jgi:regulatory protein
VTPRRQSPASPTPPARATALRLLSRRDYTVQELRSKLKARGIPETEVAAVVADLVAQNLVNDQRAADSHVRIASRIKGRGPRRIRLELEARGIDPDVARDLAGQITPEEIDRAIERIVTRRHPARPIPREARDRLFRHLLARGFPVDAITRALK